MVSVYFSTSNNNTISNTDIECLTGKYQEINLSSKIRAVLSTLTDHDVEDYDTTREALSEMSTYAAALITYITTVLP